MAEEKLGDQPVSADKARMAVATEQAQPVDLRDPDDFASGHIAGAVNASEDDLDSVVEELSEDRPVIVVCADGERSAKVAEDLRERGYEATSVEGGMNAWSGESLPVQPAEDEEFEGPRRPGPLGA